jgi:hypothetical protein
MIWLLLLLTLPRGDSPEERFRESNERARGGDYLKGIEGYRALAASGTESASLYWNWAQAARAGGNHGEALWALLRAQEIEPGDPALPREIERLRELARLDPAEIAPDPLSGARRISERLSLGLLSLVAAGASVLCHAAARIFPTRGGLGRLAIAAFVLGVVFAILPLSACFVRPTGVVVKHGAPLLDSASPTAQSLGTLREGEVVPLLTVTGEYRRVEDSSGARGWARVGDVWPLDSPPPRASEP